MTSGPLHGERKRRNEDAARNWSVQMWEFYQAGPSGYTEDHGCGQALSPRIHAQAPAALVAEMANGRGQEMV